MNRSGSASSVLSGVLGATMGYALSEGNPMLALVAATVLAPASYFVHRAAVAEAARRGEVLVDEMRVGIAEKAGPQALGGSAIAVSLVLIAVVWPSYLNINLAPRETAERLCPGLGLDFAIGGIVHIIQHVLRGVEEDHRVTA